MCCTLLAVAGCYVPVLGAPFIWDDEHLLKSPLVQELRPVAEYFSGSFWQRDDFGVTHSYYRPLSVLSLAIDRQLFGDNPGGFHLTNLSFHLLAVGLLFVLLRRQGASGSIAALCSACWGLHPRLTEAAAWVSGRTDVLAGVFVLAALLAQRAAGNAARWFTAALLLLGLLCKETALAGALAVMVMAWRSESPAVERVRRLVPTSCALATYAALRLHALGLATNTSSLPFMARIGAIAEAIGRYCWMLAVPWLPDVQIGRLRERASLFVWLGAAFFCVALVFLWRVRARLTAQAAGHFTLTLGALGLALYVIPFSVTSVAADRFLYLPVAGIVLLAQPALTRWATRSQVALPALAALALSFAAATVPRARAWADEVELWSSTLRRHPEAPSLASVTLGSIYSRQGAFEPARQLFERGSRPGMDCAQLGRNNIGTMDLRSGRYEEAARIFDELTLKYPNIGTYEVNRALAQTYLGRFAEARQTLDQLLAHDPKDVSARSLRERLPALESARRKLDTLPSSVSGAERARLQASLGLVSEALRTFDSVLRAPDATAALAAEATWLSLREGDSRTSSLFFSRYLALAADQADARLKLAYESHRELLEKLESAWPTLH